MREIMFRAWDGKRKKWLLGFEPTSNKEPNDGFNLTGETVLMGEWADTFYQFLMKKGGRTFEHLKVSQYIGLRDRNHKRIYEGDIVNRYEKHNMTAPPIALEVFWSFPSCGWSLKNEAGRLMHMSDMCILEIIGNIYENPELLKGKP